MHLWAYKVKVASAGFNQVAENTSRSVVIRVWKPENILAAAEYTAHTALQKLQKISNVYPIYHWSNSTPDVSLKEVISTMQKKPPKSTTTDRFI